MLNKSFTSDQGIWVEMAGNWSNLIDVNQFVDGVRITETVNNILRGAPADVGGEISFPYNVSDAEKLYQDWQTLQKFTNGIHYEAVEWMDAPFVQRMDPVMQELYDLNPKNFRTEENFLLFPRGSSLQDLLLDIVSTEALKESYASMIKDLDTDKPDAKFVETIETAEYWMVQFEKAAEIRDLASSFLAEHEANWENYSDDEKLTLLNEYAHQVGDVLDEKRWYDIEWINNRSSVTSVDWNINDPNPAGQASDAYGFTYPTSRNGRIYVNSDATTNTDKYNLSFLLNTVTHEARHQNQGQADYDPDRYNLPESDQTEFFDDVTYPDYWTQPWEIDARAFADITQLP